MGQKLYVSGSWDNFSSHKVMDGGRLGGDETTPAAGSFLEEAFALFI